MNKYSLDFLKVLCFENEKSKSLGKIQKQKKGEQGQGAKRTFLVKAFETKDSKKRLSVVKLTFLNKVSNAEVLHLLRKFVDNAEKRSDDFQ